MDPILINVTLTLIFLGGELFCISLLFTLNLSFSQRILAMMSGLGFLLAVVGGFYYVAAWAPFNMDACSGILTCLALIDSADFIISNHRSFALVSLIGTIVGPLSLYALKRDLFGAAIGLGLSDKEIANGR